MRTRVIISNLYHLSASDKWLFFRAYILAAFTRICIRLLGFKKTMKILTPLAKLGKTGIYHPVNIQQYHKLSILSYKTGKYLFNCLAICISYWILLRRRGIITSLKFGMILQDNELKAHSWLEYEGQPFTDKDEINVKYQPFDEVII